MLMEVIFYPAVACYINGLEKPEAPVCWSGVEDQDWDKIGQSEDGQMSATVLREEQGKALIAVL